MRKSWVVFAFLLLILLLCTIGCDFDARNLISSSKDQNNFVKVEIVFTDGQKLITYLKDLGIESNARVYVGGASTNYFYDAQGNVIGAFNYQRVLYIRILPTSTKDEAG